MEYSEFLEGKSVVVVGSSSHLIAQKQGDFIDSHDVVIRIGNSSVLPEELVEDYGKRCDVIYTWHSLMLYNKIQEKKTENAKYIFMGESRHKKADLPPTRIGKDKRWLKNKGINYEIIPKMQEFYPPLHGGMFTIFRLLEQSIGSLYVTGFSFHRTGTVVVNQSGYEIGSNTEFRSMFEEGGRLKNGMLVGLREDLDKPKKRKLTIVSYNSDIDKYYTQLNEPFSIDELMYGHNPIQEEDMFFEWVAKDDRIKLDDYLQNLRSLHLPDPIT